MTMETTKILINLLLPGTEVFSDQRYNTIMFDQLLKTTCKDFITNVKQSRSDWIKNPKTCDQATAQMEFTNLYTSFPLPAIGTGPTKSRRRLSP